MDSFRLIPSSFGEISNYLPQTLRGLVQSAPEAPSIPVLWKSFQTVTGNPSGESYVFLILGVDTGFQLFLLDHPHSRHAALRHAHAPRRRSSGLPGVGVGVDAAHSLAAASASPTNADAAAFSAAGCSNFESSSANLSRKSSPSNRESGSANLSRTSSPRNRDSGAGARNRPHQYPPRSPSFSSRNVPYRTHGDRDRDRDRSLRRSSGTSIGVHSTRVDGGLGDSFAAIKIAEDRSGPILCAQVLTPSASNEASSRPGSGTSTPTPTAPPTAADALGSNDLRLFVASGVPSSHFPRNRVRVYSVRDAAYVHAIDFEQEVAGLLASRDHVSVIFQNEIHLLSSSTYETLNIMPCFPNPTSGCVCAMGSRWVAYAARGPIDTSADTASGETPSSLSYDPSERSRHKRSSGSRSSTTPHTRHASVDAGSGGSGGGGTENPTSSLSRFSEGSYFDVAMNVASGVYSFGETSRKAISSYLNPEGGAGDVTASIKSALSRSRKGGERSTVQSEPGYVTVRDMVTTEMIANFKAHDGVSLSSLHFAKSGNMLVTVPEDGQYLHVFRVMSPFYPPPASASDIDARAPSVQHLYRIFRGVTHSIVREISLSTDNAWLSVCSSRGTTHIYSLTSHDPGTSDGPSASLKSPSSAHPSPELSPLNVNALHRIRHRSCSVELPPRPVVASFVQHGSSGDRLAVMSETEVTSYSLALVPPTTENDYPSLQLVTLGRISLESALTSSVQTSSLHLLERSSLESSTDNDEKDAGQNAAWWLSHVELATHAAPDVALWQSPQFTFEAFPKERPAESSSVLDDVLMDWVSESRPISVATMHSPGVRIFRNDAAERNLEEALSHHVDSPLISEAAGSGGFATPRSRRLSASSSSPAAARVDPLTEEAGDGRHSKKRTDFGIEGSLLVGSALTDSMQTTYEPFQSPSPSIEAKKLPADTDTGAEMEKRLPRRDQHGTKGGGGGGRSERKSKQKRNRRARKKQQQQRRDEEEDEFAEDDDIYAESQAKVPSARGSPDVGPQQGSDD